MKNGKRKAEMNFDELDKKMRIYEQSLDQVLLPEIYLVARLDGRGFTRLTKEICKFEAPFDIRFRDMMVLSDHFALHTLVILIA